MRKIVLCSFLFLGFIHTADARVCFLPGIFGDNETCLSDTDYAQCRGFNRTVPCPDGQEQVTCTKGGQTYYRCYCRPDTYQLSDNPQYICTAGYTEECGCAGRNLACTPEYMYEGDGFGHCLDYPNTNGVDACILPNGKVFYKDCRCDSDTYRYTCSETGLDPEAPEYSCRDTTGLQYYSQCRCAAGWSQNCNNHFGCTRQTFSVQFKDGHNCYKCDEAMCLTVNNINFERYYCEALFDNTIEGMTNLNRVNLDCEDLGYTYAPMGVCPSNTQNAGDIGLKCPYDQDYMNCDALVTDTFLNQESCEASKEGVICALRPNSSEYIIIGCKDTTAYTYNAEEKTCTPKPCEDGYKTGLVLCLNDNETLDTNTHKSGSEVCAKCACSGSAPAGCYYTYSSADHAQLTTTAGTHTATFAGNAVLDDQCCNGYYKTCQNLCSGEAYEESFVANAAEVGYCDACGGRYFEIKTCKDGYDLKDNRCVASPCNEVLGFSSDITSITQCETSEGLYNGAYGWSVIFQQDSSGQTVKSGSAVCAKCVCDQPTVPSETDLCRWNLQNKGVNGTLDENDLCCNGYYKNCYADFPEGATASACSDENATSVTSYQACNYDSVCVIEACKSGYTLENNACVVRNCETGYSTEVQNESDCPNGAIGRIFNYGSSPENIGALRCTQCACSSSCTYNDTNKGGGSLSGYCCDGNYQTCTPNVPDGYSSTCASGNCITYEACNQTYYKPCEEGYTVQDNVCVTAPCTDPYSTAKQTVYDCPAGEGWVLDNNTTPAASGDLLCTKCVCEAPEACIYTDSNKGSGTLSNLCCDGKYRTCNPNVPAGYSTAACGLSNYITYQACDTTYCKTCAEGYTAQDNVCVPATCSLPYTTEKQTVSSCGTGAGWILNNDTTPAKSGSLLCTKCTCSAPSTCIYNDANKGGGSLSEPCCDGAYQGCTPHVPDGYSRAACAVGNHITYQACDTTYCKACAEGYTAQDNVCVATDCETGYSTSVQNENNCPNGSIGRTFNYGTSPEKIGDLFCTQCTCNAPGTCTYDNSNKGSGTLSNQCCNGKYQTCAPNLPDGYTKRACGSQHATTSFYSACGETYCKITACDAGYVKNADSSDCEVSECSLPYTTENQLTSDCGSGEGWTLKNNTTPAKSGSLLCTKCECEAPGTCTYDNSNKGNGTLSNPCCNDKYKTCTPNTPAGYSIGACSSENHTVYEACGVTYCKTCPAGYTVQNNVCIATSCQTGYSTSVQNENDCPNGSIGRTFNYGTSPEKIGDLFCTQCTCNAPGTCTYDNSNKGSGTLSNQCCNGKYQTCTPNVPEGYTTSACSVEYATKNTYTACGNTYCQVTACNSGRILSEGSCVCDTAHGYYSSIQTGGTHSGQLNGCYKMTGCNTGDGWLSGLTTDELSLVNYTSSTFNTLSASNLTCYHLSGCKDPYMTESNCSGATKVWTAAGEGPIGGYHCGTCACDITHCGENCATTVTTCDTGIYPYTPTNHPDHSTPSGIPCTPMSRETCAPDEENKRWPDFACDTANGWSKNKAGTGCAQCPTGWYIEEQKPSRSHTCQEYTSEDKSTSNGTITCYKLNNSACRTECSDYGYYTSGDSIISDDVHTCSIVPYFENDLGNDMDSCYDCTCDTANAYYEACPDNGGACYPNTPQDGCYHATLCRSMTHHASGNVDNTVFDIDSVYKFYKSDISNVTNCYHVNGCKTPYVRNSDCNAVTNNWSLADTKGGYTCGTCTACNNDEGYYLEADKPTDYYCYDTATGYGDVTCNKCRPLATYSFYLSGNFYYNLSGGTGYTSGSVQYTIKGKDLLDNDVNVSVTVNGVQDYQTMRLSGGSSTFNEGNNYTLRIYRPKYKLVGSSTTTNCPYLTITYNGHCYTNFSNTLHAKACKNYDSSNRHSISSYPVVVTYVNTASSANVSCYNYLPSNN